MKTKINKIFDAVQMVREIRDAYYWKRTDKNFDLKTFDRIKEKWEKRLEDTKAEYTHNKN